MLTKELSPAGFSPEGLSKVLPEVNLSKKYAEESSLDDLSAVSYASELLASGGIVVAQMRGVYGLFANANRPDALQAIRDIKQDDPRKPFSTMMPGGTFVRMLDTANIHPGFRQYCGDPDTYDSTKGCTNYTNGKWT